MIPSLTLPLVKYAPRFSDQAAQSVAGQLYGLRATATRLPSERDQNFLLVGERQQKFVLKIANLLEDEALLNAETDAIAYLGKQLEFLPQIIKSQYGRSLERAIGDNGEAHLVRLATYLPGLPLGEIQCTAGLLHDIGHKIGEMDRALQEFDHPSIHRNFHWDLANWRTVTEQCGKLIPEAELRSIVGGYCDFFAANMAPLLDGLRRSCIHGDTNDYNILVQDSEVAGIIDFGDMVYTYTVADLAIAVAYIALRSDQPLEVTSAVAVGYHKALPLTQTEIETLWGLAVMRLCMSACIAAYQQQQQPDNQYLNISQRAINTRLRQLTSIDPHRVTKAVQRALTNS